MDYEKLTVGSVYTFAFYTGESSSTATLLRIEKNVSVSEVSKTLYTFLLKKSVISLSDEYLLELEDDVVRKIR